MNKQPSRDMTPDVLKRLIERALEATRNLDDSREVEPYFYRVLEVLRENHSLREPAARMFITELERSRTFVVDLLAYCMHELRWPEIRDRAAALMEPVDSEEWRRKSRAYRWVLAAYEDDWCSREIYAYYGEGEVPPTVSE